MCEVSVDQPRVCRETDPWPSLHAQHVAREQLTNVEQSIESGGGDIFLTPLCARYKTPNKCKFNNTIQLKIFANFPVIIKYGIMGNHWGSKLSRISRFLCHWDPQKFSPQHFGWCQTPFDLTSSVSSLSASVSSCLVMWSETSVAVTLPRMLNGRETSTSYSWISNTAPRISTPGTSFWSKIKCRDNSICFSITAGSVFYTDS